MKDATSRARERDPHVHVRSQSQVLTIAQPRLNTRAPAHLSVVPSPVPCVPMAAALTARELLLLQLLGRGCTSQQVAALLTTTPTLVDRLIERATKKLGATHWSHAVAIAQRQGLII